MDDKIKTNNVLSNEENKQAKENESNNVNSIEQVEKAVSMVIGSVCASEFNEPRKITAARALEFHVKIFVAKKV